MRSKVVRGSSTVRALPRGDVMRDLFERCVSYEVREMNKTDEQQAAEIRGDRYFDLQNRART